MGLKESVETLNRAVMNVIGRDVATVLGDGWLCDLKRSDAEVAVLVHPDGRSIWMRCRWNEKDRVSISGGFQADNTGQTPSLPYGVAAPGVTVAIERGPVAIAKAIASRFFPEYNPLFEKQLQRVKESNEYFAKILAKREKICKLFGTKLKTNEHGEQPRDVSLYLKQHGEYKDTISADFIACSSGYDLKLSVPDVLAEKIADLIAQHAKDHDYKA